MKKEKTNSAPAGKADKDVAEMSNTINLTGKSGPTQGPEIMSGVASIRLKGTSSKDFSGTGKRLLGYLKPCKAKLILVIMMTILSAAFAIISPKLLGSITSHLQTSVRDTLLFDYTLIICICFFLLGLYILSSVFDYTRIYIMAGLTQNLVRDLRREVDAKISRLTLKYLDQSKIGEIMSRATNDIDNISTALQASFAETISAFVTILGVTIAMLLIDPLITFICIITIPLGTIITTVIVRLSQKHFKKQALYLGQINAAVEESFSGHRIIKAFGREKASSSAFANISGKYCEEASKAQYASGFTYPALV